MMGDFARKQLEKYGWKEGQGLGKNGEGMSEPVKVKLKRDTVGVGYRPVAEEGEFWWASCFNRAANSLTVSNTTEGTVSISSSCDVAGDVSKRCYSRHRASLVHRGFLPSRVTQCGSREEREGEGEGGGESGAVAARTDEGGGTWRMTDEELLKACGGRTGHKAARHGLSLAGKLQRLHTQDKLHRKSLRQTKSRHKSRNSRTQSPPNRPTSCS